VEASSLTITSKSVQVDSRTLRIVSPIYLAALYEGIHTLTRFIQEQALLCVSRAFKKAKGRINHEIVGFATPEFLALWPPVCNSPSLVDIFD
jgi:hypothetical protein